MTAAFIKELATLQDNVPPLTQEEVVHVMEQELGVPWEDVFESIVPEPMAAGTIAEVHRATLTGGERVVVKVQRPTARKDIMENGVYLRPSRYGKLRREPRRDGLSTLEAAAMLMARIERNPKIEAALNTSFAKMLERYRALHGKTGNPEHGLDEVQDGVERHLLVIDGHPRPRRCAVRRRRARHGNFR